MSGFEIGLLKKNNIKYVSLIISSFLIGSSIFSYSYFGYKYKKEELEQKKQSEMLLVKLKLAEKQVQQEQLQECIDEVSTKWTSFIEDDKNKLLSDESIKMILELNLKEKDDCFKKFP